MNWEEVQAINRESIESTSKVEESIHIQINVANMNQMEGAYKLLRTWDQVLPTCRAGGGHHPSDLLCSEVIALPFSGDSEAIALTSSGDSFEKVG